MECYKLEKLLTRLNGLQTNENDELGVADVVDNDLYNYSLDE